MNSTGVFRCRSCGQLNRAAPGRAGARCGACKTGLDTSGAPQHVGDAELDRILAASPVPVLVDFYADWCGPCRMLAPTLEQLASQTAGRLIVLKVDTERDQRHASRLGVRGIPAVYLFKDGQTVAQETGVRPLPHWQRLVAPHLSP